jgi:hypothetical protein
MTEYTPENPRVFLAERREVLRGSYARFREFGRIMGTKSLVHWSNEAHGYISDYEWRTRTFTIKERETIKQLLELQRNIYEQALLLLELEHAIDQEEAKQTKAEFAADHMAPYEAEVERLKPDEHTEP